MPNTNNRLQSKYMGLDLKNPIIAGSCNLTSDVDKAKKIEEAGAGAIVFKSLFEEQIELESLQMQEEIDEYADRHAEMTSLFPRMEHAGAKSHLTALKKVKKALSIPVIGSLNCVASESWVNYAKQMEETGIDAIELNFHSAPRNFEKTGQEAEDEQIAILEDVQKSITIPISVKISPYYTNPLHFIRRLSQTGAAGITIFNRFFQPDIDLLNQKFVNQLNLSSKNDHKIVLRFTGLLYDRMVAQICANSGIHTGKDALKMIAAGADAVQIVSTLYLNKISYIQNILQDMEKYLEQTGFETLDDMRGHLSDKATNDPLVYRRAQYVDILLKGDEDIIKKYKQP
jgi:dihydroorotate dehydrogenase (fumarate)